ncbi:hypothetical protein ECH7EC4486_2696 [Escherichia coli O157:H7 str. EC4486]|nr:hypothetical protein ECH7EC4486_2696 [Escherichia coli O157:H7 str. EC4486]
MAKDAATLQYLSPSAKLKTLPSLTWLWYCCRPDQNWFYEPF